MNYIKHIILTVLLLFATILLFENSSLDIAIQDIIFNHATMQWPLTKTEQPYRLLLYDGIKRIFIAIIIAIVVVQIVLRKWKWLQVYRKGLLILTLSAIVVPTAINELKAVTNVPCPNDLSYYGGSYPYISIFSSYPKEFIQTEKIRCYPAGHASGGFVFLALWFLFQRRTSRIIGISSGLLLGWVTGGYKMAIGDHFLSHTIVTMLIAWLIIILIAAAVNRYWVIPIDAKPGEVPN